MDKSNGMAGLMVKGAIGIFIAITVTLTSVFAGSMVHRQERTEDTQVEHGQRLSTLEAFNKSMHEDVQKMDRKLDTLLERVPR